MAATNTKTQTYKKIYVGNNIPVHTTAGWLVLVDSAFTQ